MMRTFIFGLFFHALVITPIMPLAIKAAKEDFIILTGQIKNERGDNRFLVILDNRHIILAHLPAKRRKQFIRLRPGDKVEVKMSPYNLTQGEIISGGL